MPKMIIAKGLPASGKSTEAEKRINDAGGSVVRINKDLLRTMLHFDKFNHTNEDNTRLAARVIAETFLSKGTSVIIDDTNLNEKTLQSWKDMAKQLKADIEYIDMTHIGVKECIDRDQHREKTVGASVILKMALQNLEYLKGEKVVICDIDGTIADCTHRLIYAKGETKNWDTFFSLLHLDTPRMDVIMQVSKIARENNAQVLFVSARPEKYRAETMNWMFDSLLGSGIETRFIGLIMRDSHDKRVDTEVKKDILDKYLSKLSIVKVFDDRPSVIRMWRENGLEVEDVGQGEEF